MASTISVTDAAKKWADSQGLSYDDPRVQRYMASTGGQNAGVDEEIDVEDTREFKAGQQYARENGEFDWQDTNDERFKQAVMHYAESQGVALDDPRVIKYATGLKSRKGDFGGREQDTQVGARK